MLFIVVLMLPAVWRMPASEANFVDERRHNHDSQ